MKQLVMTERFCLIGHLFSMVFGWAGLLLIVPNPELILNLPGVGQSLFQWGMAGGGVVNIILGAVVIAIYAYRTLGTWQWLTFMVSAVCLSLGSELLGTSTGLPFGDYHYLNGLGYKIAGLVPFTIPISWFYMGLVSYVLARVAMKADEKPSLVRTIGAIALGAMLFTSWDFALEPAMTQITVPFWFWEKPGAFFGTPYQNYAGWFGTSALFMSVATIFWSKKPVSDRNHDRVELTRSQLTIPLIVYLSNIAYPAVLSLAAGFTIPVSLSLLVGVTPALIIYATAKTNRVVPELKTVSLKTEIPVEPLKVAVK